MSSIAIIQYFSTEMYLGFGYPYITADIHLGNFKTYTLPPVSVDAVPDFIRFILQT